MARHGLILLYRGATRLAGLGAAGLLAWRRGKGKEHPVRWPERLGIAGEPRPDGRIAWLHGASVGETMSLLPLVDGLMARGYIVLVTSGTVTSAEIMGRRLPEDAIHQFAPLDAPKFVNRFLDHWQPEIALVAESEIWPNMLIETDRRGIPIILVNARVSERSFERWRKSRGLAGALLSFFDLCLARTGVDAGRLIDLGAPRVLVAGNLKYDVPPLPVEGAALADLAGRVGARPLWVAASTHPGEEELILEAHRALLGRFPRLLTIIVPRHPGRGEEIAALIDDFGLTQARRSRGEVFGRDTAIYLADTIGELGLFYRLAALAFVGGSLVENGGQNPIEPARLGCAILHGPHVANFAEDYALLDGGRGAGMVRDGDELVAALTALMTDASRQRAMARAAAETVDRLGGATSRILHAIEPYAAQALMRHLG